MENAVTGPTPHSEQNEQAGIVEGAWPACILHIDMTLVATETHSALTSLRVPVALPPSGLLALHTAGGAERRRRPHGGGCGVGAGQYARLHEVSAVDGAGHRLHRTEMLR